MKIFVSPLHTHKKDAPAKQTPQNNTIHTSLAAISPIILQNQNLSESGGNQSSKCSMKMLCELYLQKINSKSPCEFLAKEIVLNTRIKQRRVYDLMNILEGCGYVKRISKGKYESFKLDTQQQPTSELLNVQETSLSSMAFQVKKLLFQSKQFINFKDICEAVFDESLKKKVSIDSLKRRIYECCKVLKVLGLAQKNGTSFKWKEEFGGPQLNQVQKKEKKKQKQAKNRQKQKQKETDWHKPIIQSIVNQIGSQRELVVFMESLKEEYTEKINGVSVKRQLKYQ